MRDLIRNYRNIIARRNESDTESEPLMVSTSSSSPRSFGTAQNSNVFAPDLLMDLESDLDGSINERSLNSGRKDLIYENRRKSTHSMLGQGHARSKDHLVVDFPTPSAAAQPPDSTEKPKTQSSVVTIFSIWNTTMGSSLLAMSWGLEKTGLIPGVCINILVAGLCLYTCHILLEINRKHGVPGQDVADLCRELLGPWAQQLAKLFSIVVLLGANIVYWILMSNFLYNSVGYFINGGPEGPPILCPKDANLTIIKEPNLGTKYWDLYSTVPVLLAVIMFPLLNFKSATFFTKFNSLGTVSVTFIVAFVSIKSYQFGYNLPDFHKELYLRPTFVALSGMLSLSYFIHNIVISIMRSNRNQEKNGRDLSIAFVLVTVTYIFMGVVFYISFPLAKSCIEDNILNNFPQSDIMAIVARLLLLFQLCTVFPLLSFMLRHDILSNLRSFTKTDSTWPVILLNLCLLTICVLFACFMPKIGTLIRYTGAASGLVYIFMLPSLLKMASLRKDNQLSAAKMTFYISIVVIGTLNLLAQFLITV